MQDVFKKIKELFAKKDVSVVLQKYTIPFSEIEQWLEQRFQQNAKSITQTAQPLLDKIDDCLFALHANMTKLEHAELRNKGISARELGIMKGNKNSYMLRTRQFHAQLSSLLQKENVEGISYSQMKALAGFYFQEIESYHAATLKPYAVLQHFFANESYAVAKNIKDLDEAMSQLQQLLSKQSHEAITEIKKEILLLQEKIQQKKNLLDQQEQAEEELIHFKELEAQAAEKQKKIEEGTGYQHYLNVLLEKEIAVKKTENHLQLLQRHFSVIDKAVRKFVRIQPEQEQFLTYYLEKPFEALQQDAAFIIIPLLALVRDQLLADALEIKDDKKEKTAAELAILTEEYLRAFLAEHNALFLEQKELEKRCSSDFAKQQYDEAVYMHKTYKEKTEAYCQEKEKIAAEITALAIPETLLQLQKDVQTCMKQDVEIVL